MIPQDMLLVKIIKLIRVVIPEIQLPIRRGAPYVYSPAIMMCCFVVMVAKQLSVRGLHAFLTTTDDFLAIRVRQVINFPKESIPHRRTFDRRLKQWSLSAQLYMLSALTLFMTQFKVGVARLALDNRMFAAFGAIWHRKDQKAGIIQKKLRNVDKTAGWGVSAYRNWVFGHGLDIIVTTGKLVIPVLAIGRSLQIRGNTGVKQLAYLVTKLPKVQKGVVATDSEYEDQELDQLFQLTGRKLHAAKRRNPKATPKSKTYLRRKVTCEPMNERWLQAFGLREKLDRPGPQAQPYLITCCFLYQVMVLYTLMMGKEHPLQVTHLIRFL